MKKRSLMFIIFMLACGGLVAWLSGLDTGEEPAPSPAATAQIVSASPGSVEGEEETGESIEISSSRLRSYQQAAEKAMEATWEVYQGADKGSSTNVVLTDEAVAQMVSALGQAGYPAVDYFGELDMSYPQPVLDFGAAVNAGEDAETVYYVVHRDGTVHANHLIYENGLACSVTVSVEWEGSHAEVYSYGQYDLSTLRLTDKGWLICTRAGSSWATNGNAYTFLRVSPYDSTLRQLTERYMGDQAYSENDLFTVSWDGGMLDRLDFNSIFVFLYSRYYGTVPMTSSTLKGVAGYETVPGSDLYIAPSSQYEEVLSHYLGLDADTIRYYSDYSSRYGGYLVLGSDQSYYNEVTPKLPFPEVTGYINNSDGSITLMVDAVYPAYETDRAFSHELTVMETEDGFRYVSNYMHSSEDDMIPSRVLASERKNQIAALG